MTESANFQSPLSYDTFNAVEYDGMLLPGGHSPGMRPYLESPILQSKVSQFWKLGRPIAAICHGTRQLLVEESSRAWNRVVPGTLVLARAKDPESGRSLLYDRSTTSLLESMERFAYVVVSSSFRPITSAPTATTTRFRSLSFLADLAMAREAIQDLREVLRRGGDILSGRPGTVSVRTLSLGSGAVAVHSTTASVTVPTINFFGSLFFLMFLLLLSP
jgi:hypothetical protein